MTTADLDFAESPSEPDGLDWLAGVFAGLAHPVRLRMLLACAKRALSAKDLARHFDVTVGAAAYHVRTLRAAGLLELVARRPVRGSVQSFYRLSDAGRSAVAALEATRSAGRCDREPWAPLKHDAPHMRVRVAADPHATVTVDATVPQRDALAAARMLAALTRLEAEHEHAAAPRAEHPCATTRRNAAGRAARPTAPIIGLAERKVDGSA